MGINIKHELEQGATSQEAFVRLTKDMTIMNTVKALGPEIHRTLSAVLTPERFTRMALSSINNTPELAKYTPMSSIAALSNAARSGLEPNTSPGRAYLIPYKGKGRLECQFQLGYKGLIDLAYRIGQVQIIQTQVVRGFNSFKYQCGPDSKLIHKPGEGARGKITYVCGLFRLSSGDYGFGVSDKTRMDTFVARYSKSFGSKYSPWAKDYEPIAKKTMIKRVLRYTSISSDFRKTLSIDETIRTGIAVDMDEIRNECLPEEAGSETA